MYEGICGGMKVFEANGLLLGGMYKCVEEYEGV